MQSAFGPQITPVIIDPEQVAVYLAKKFSMPDTLIRDEEQRKQISQMMQQLASQAQGAEVAN